LNQWNKASGQQKQIVHYFDNSATKEFIEALVAEETKERNSVEITLSDIYTKKRGIVVGTWMNLLLFIDLLCG